ncbi:acyl dehydratase [Cytobacillus horneckiae]|uniref:MaoC family dehydratase n=1 Tax=Cytobacillus horneckiae TaxID=549687 RepID=A0A2N0ZKZ7_9BACI|nr:MaoC family dehydratase N-terminal domain-containing protein [Cytobacillus horneckiae]MBN6885588.1 MaoC family dehydratase N-terminal domain-containing protein [Cytobacillus horneckiae]MCM3180450.1 MaoC family dehydratase N-terminal domain-containing protein [Cytobacillus horneckiae]MEC1156301.1 MaoC family dehydratase N-terminal domain-containing protein [Cytobacillus horneckiae]MED2938319.1 MaoC family dehydratase N-terminal domain-containing protein [Cytobacillus horneckiae]PKG30168.1 Ma
MSNVKDLIGLELEPYSMAVEKGKIKELALALGDDNPIYYDLEAAKKEGYDGIPIPPTFLQVIDLWGGLGSAEKVEKLKFNLVRVLHGQQAYEYLGDIVAGDVLSVTSKVVAAETKSGSTGVMEFVSLENQYQNQRGELVAITRSTLVHRL